MPLSKDMFKAALEAYSIGMPTSPDTEIAMLQTSRRVRCRRSEAQQSPHHTSAKAIAVYTGTLLCAVMVTFGKGQSGCLMVVFPDACSGGVFLCAPGPRGWSPCGRLACALGVNVGKGRQCLTAGFPVCPVVVNFYAPWCPWCQRLEPTWEAVTQEVHAKYPDSDGRIRYAKVASSSSVTVHWLGGGRCHGCQACFQDGPEKCIKCSPEVGHHVTNRWPPDESCRC